MIIVDTNVVSALMAGARQGPGLVRWFDEQGDQDFRLTAISLFELRFGIARLPEGSRKLHLEAGLGKALGDVFAGRVLPFDAQAADAAARLQAGREARGRKVELAEAQIAGIAISRRATICTRNVRHFEDAGVPILNPWG